MQTAYVRTFLTQFMRSEFYHSLAALLMAVRWDLNFVRSRMYENKQNTI